MAVIETVFSVVDSFSVIVKFHYMPTCFVGLVSVAK